MLIFSNFGIVMAGGKPRQKSNSKVFIKSFRGGLNKGGAGQSGLNRIFETIGTPGNLLSSPNKYSASTESKTASM